MSNRLLRIGALISSCTLFALYVGYQAGCLSREPKPVNTPSQPAREAFPGSKTDVVFPGSKTNSGSGGLFNSGVFSDGPPPPASEPAVIEPAPNP